MQKFLSTAALLIAAPLFAQDQTFPPAFDTKDGGGSNGRFGRTADGRIQLMYGDLFGNSSVFSWTGMQWRRSTTKVDMNDERTYSNVNVKVGQWDLVTTDAWASNLGTGPTTVFNGAFTLPETTGLPPSTPSPWGFGDAAGELELRFTAPYLFASKEGLTVDITYSGGVMKNSIPFKEYWVDAIPDCNMTTTASGSNSGQASCPASGVFTNWLHSDRMPAAKSGPVFRTQLYMYGPTANANQPHFGVISNFPLATSSPFLGSCNELYIDLALPFATYPFVTDSAGDHFSPFFVAPFIASVVGFDLWAQAATDINNNIELTRAGTATFAALPTGAPFSVSQRLYAVNGGTGIGGSGFPLGYGPYDSNIPVIRMIL